jgi:hypothetical protein
MFSSLISLFMLLLPGNSAKATTVAAPVHPPNIGTMHADDCTTDPSGSTCRTDGTTHP